MFRVLCVLLASAQALAGPAHVLFVVDGAPDWTALTAQLPAPDAAFFVVPPVSEGATPESAAVASAMSTGCPSQRRGVSDAGIPLGLRASAAGAALGAVTDACPSDPTVAAFFGSAPDRYDAARVAAAVRDANISILLGGASRLFASSTGGACFPETKQALARSLRECNASIVGTFGDVSAALAAECLPMPFMGAAGMPSLRDMTSAALARLRASTPGSNPPNTKDSPKCSHHVHTRNRTHAGAPLFLLVAADRMDHAAHAGDAAAVTHEAADVAAAVLAAVYILAHRADAIVVVTGDHATPLNGTAHSPEKVPVLVYGHGARAAAARAIGRSRADDALHPPSINASDLPLLFPYFPATGSRSCTRGARADRSWIFIGVALAAIAVAAACLALINVRRKKD